MLYVLVPLFVASSIAFAFAYVISFVIVIFTASLYVSDTAVNALSVTSEILYTTAFVNPDIVPA
jgi:hypothetical protein